MELSPTQIPQMMTSLNYDSELLSVKVPRVSSSRAAELVNQAKLLYADRSWKPYLEVFQTARAVVNDPALKARIDKELLWVTQVEQAEVAADKSDYSEEAADWDRASELFSARTWTTEKAALARLKGDREVEAIPLLTRLSLVSDEGTAARARRMLASLSKSEPQLSDLVKKSQTEVSVPTGAEFELVEIPR